MQTGVELPSVLPPQVGFPPQSDVIRDDLEQEHWKNVSKMTMFVGIFLTNRFLRRFKKDSRDF